MTSTRAIATLGGLVAALVAPGCKDSVAPPIAITVTAVSPGSGPLAGGTSVTITGANFIDVTSVTIGGAELGSRTVLSPTQINGTTPAATSQGAKDVVVTSSSHGRGTCSGCFRYTLPVSAAAAPLAAGVFHTCSLNSSGAAYCWGSGSSGALGDGSNTISASPVAVSGGLSFRALTASEFHTCGLTGAGAAYCWGGNDEGELGDGSTTDRSTPVAVAGGLSFSVLATGGGHTCGLTSDG